MVRILKLYYSIQTSTSLRQNPKMARILKLYYSIQTSTSLLQHTQRHDTTVVVLSHLSHVVFLPVSVFPTHAVYPVQTSEVSDFIAVDNTPLYLDSLTLYHQISQQVYKWAENSADWREIELIIITGLSL